jgi:sugar phosphate isomerase/epimerase
MMRLSCLTLSYQNQFRAGKMDIFSFLTTCRALDLDGADIHINSLKNTSTPHLKEVRRKALDSGLSVSCLGVSTEFGRSAENIPRELNKAKEAIQVGMFLGAPLLRVFVGSAPSPDKAKEAFDRGVDALRKTAEMGAEAGILVSLQNHSGLTSTGADMLAFLKAVDHPNFTLLMDTGHFAGREGPNGPKIAGTTYNDYYHSLEQMAPITRFVRVKFYEPDSTGKEKYIDYTRVMNILRGVHYNGFLGIVYEGKEDETQAVPRCARYMRQVMRA